MPRYNRQETVILSVIFALAREYHCKIVVGFAEHGSEVSILLQGRLTTIGAITDIRGMTLRGLIGFFEQARQEWRHETT
ncbi:MAG: hypothetical protein AUI84_15890 [Delftia sp. 13_1_40CM_3_66_6]|nr:MAG: hypothetical protein AUI84_15890 [Delftia sp. 13_1_40CM_3_66_6]